MFLTGTLLNVVAVLLGTTVGFVAARWVGPSLREALTTGLGFFVTAIAISLAISVFDDPAVLPGDSLVVLGSLLIGVVIGEWLGIQARLEALGEWFQRRLVKGEEPSRVAEAFVTASLVYCVGPLTILGPIDNGLRGDITLLATKSLLDGVASIAFAAALGPGVYLSAITVFVIQGSIAAGAFLLRDALDARTVVVLTATGGLVMLGIALRLFDLRAVRVANFLPALLVVPVLLAVSDAVRAAFGA
jgi:uncharacterized protein